MSIVLFQGGASPRSQTLKGLKIYDKFFYEVDGTPITLIECSDFSAFCRFLRGEEIRSVLGQRSELGFNLVRNWLLNKSVVGRRNCPTPSAQPPLDDGIDPREHDDFYDKLIRFHELCESYGLYVENTVFTSTPSLMPRFEDQVTHLMKTAAALRECNTPLLELVNEADHGNPRDNETDSRLLWMKPQGVISSSGSNGSDADPPEPDWDYCLYHTNDAPEWQRRCGHNAMEIANQRKKPCLSNENTRYPDNENTPTRAYDAMLGAAILCAGACFHSEQGKYSQVFTGETLDCAKQWVAGAKAADLTLRTGTYVHRQDLEGPGVVRVYEKHLGDRMQRISIRE